MQVAEGGLAGWRQAAAAAQRHLACAPQRRLRAAKVASLLQQTCQGHLQSIAFQEGTL